jgi:hypothetical protein
LRVQILDNINDEEILLKKLIYIINKKDFYNIKIAVQTLFSLGLKLTLDPTRLTIKQIRQIWSSSAKIEVYQERFLLYRKLIPELKFIDPNNQLWGKFHISIDPETWTILLSE